MEIYFLRHGDAEAPMDNTWEADFERNLSDIGIKDIQAEARGMKKLIDGFNLILSSPYPRAVQTAEIMGTTLGCSSAIKITENLRPPCRLENILEDIAMYIDSMGEKEAVEKTDEDESHQLGVRQRVLLVGHEPILGELLTELLTGLTEESLFPFRKGGMARIDMEELKAGKDAYLVFFLDPVILMELGKETLARQKTPEEIEREKRREERKGRLNQLREQAIGV